MEEFLEDIGLERYAPRFAENDVHAIEDLPTKPSKLETVLDVVGITGNPGHLKKFKAALEDARANDPGGGASAKRGRDGDGEGARAMTGTNDPAAAIKAAMAEAKARGGGVIGGSAKTQAGAITATGMAALPVGDTPDSVRTVEDSIAAATNDIEAATDDEVLRVLELYKSQDFLSLLGLPGVWVDASGQATWDKHPAMSTGTVALKAKLLALRLEPSRCPHPLAAEAYECALDAARALQGKDSRRKILTLAVQRRIEDMRRKGEGDVEGGYVSMTGVHYAAGAAASAVANYRGEDEGAHGPALNPAAGGGGGGGGGVRLKPSAAAMAAGGASVDGTHGGAPPAAIASVPGEMRARGEGEARVKVDLGGIRDKLKAAKKRPRFM
jgi:hypothetical protein